MYNDFRRYSLSNELRSLFKMQLADHQNNFLSEEDLHKLHREITAAFEESTRNNNKDWLKYFWEIMMEESKMSKQQLIDFMLDELSRGNSESREMLESIIHNTDH